MKLLTMTAIDMLGATVCMVAFLASGITAFGAGFFFATIGFAASLCVNHKIAVPLAFPILWGASALSAWLFIIAVVRWVLA